MDKVQITDLSNIYFMLMWLVYTYTIPVASSNFTMYFNLFFL
jgi:hypothetical protein